jgi:hypothetical protein
MFGLRFAQHQPKKKQRSLCMDSCWLLKANTFEKQLLDIETLFYSFNAVLAKTTKTKLHVLLGFEELYDYHKHQQNSACIAL